MGDLRTVLRSLVELGVGMEVTNGQAAFSLPEKEPARSKAEKAVRAELDLIRAARDDVVRLWAEVAAERRVGVWVCKECKALVLDPAEAATSRWAFCESLYCPYRKDGPAVRFRRSDYETRRLAEQRRVRAIALGEEVPEPIPE